MGAARTGYRARDKWASSCPFRRGGIGEVGKHHSEEITPPHLTGNPTVSTNLPALQDSCRFVLLDGKTVWVLVHSST